MNKRLLELLRCPVSGQTLAPLSPAQHEALKRALEEGRARCPEGQPCTAPKQGLTTPAFDRVYRIEDGIPVLLASEAIELPPATDR